MIQPHFAPVFLAHSDALLDQHTNFFLLLFVQTCFNFSINGMHKIIELLSIASLRTPVGLQHAVYWLGKHPLPQLRASTTCSYPPR